MNKKKYDVIVIGAGPAGYVCSIRCAQLGLKVACIDEWSDKNNKPSPGGTCLNVGCIPSKALLDSSHHYSFISEHASEHGIETTQVSVNVAKMQQRKNKVVKTLTTGVKGLLKKNNVDLIHGSATIKDANNVNVIKDENEDLFSANSIVIASGSRPLELSILPVDQKHILDSTGALAIDSVPEHLGVIGAGVIGLEMASVWRRLGSKVTIWEATDSFLPTADKEIAKQAYKTLDKQGIEIKLNSNVQNAAINGESVDVTVINDSGEIITNVSKLLVAVGRVANTQHLDLDKVGVDVDERGFIKVDNKWNTSINGIYAIGDVIGGAMLAHKGSEEGMALADILAGQFGHMNYSARPWVVYTWPEIAWAGKTEQELVAEGVSYKTGSFPFMALGRARAMGDIEGTIKLISDANTDRLIGAHIFGPNASELIAEAVVAIESELTAEDLACTIHAHPTLSEGMHEAALDLHGRVIHF